MINNEKDYLEVAKRENEEKILDNHWKNCVKTNTWFSSTGESYSFDDLDTHHLNSIIKMLVRFIMERPSKSLQELINALVDEETSRW